MGVKRGSFETVKRGRVSRPDNITGHAPSVAVGNGLHAAANAIRSLGDAEIARGKRIASEFDGWGKAVEWFASNFGKLAETYIGYHNKAREDSIEKIAKLDEYKKLCMSDPSKYSRETMATKMNEAENAQRRSESVWMIPEATDDKNKYDNIEKFETQIWNSETVFAQKVKEDWIRSIPDRIRSGQIDLGDEELNQKVIDDIENHGRRDRSFFYDRNKDGKPVINSDRLIDGGRSLGIGSIA